MVELEQIKTYFIRQYFKLYLDPRSGYTDQNQNHDQDLGSNLVNHEQSSFADQAKFVR